VLLRSIRSRTIRFVNSSEPVTLRLAAAADLAALRRLAERDSAAVPPAPQLIAIRGRELEAAISLTSGELVADPFRPTADLRDLLRYAARRRPAPLRPRRVRRRTRSPLLRERLA
jgi:hypothetical protein